MLCQSNFKEPIYTTPLLIQPQFYDAVVVTEQGSTDKHHMLLQCFLWTVSTSKKTFPLCTAECPKTRVLGADFGIPWQVLFVKLSTQTSYAWCQVPLSKQLA